MTHRVLLLIYQIRSQYCFASLDSLNACDYWKCCVYHCHYLIQEVTGSLSSDSEDLEDLGAGPTVERGLRGMREEAAEEAEHSDDDF